MPEPLYQRLLGLRGVVDAHGEYVGGGKVEV